MVLPFFYSEARKNHDRSRFLTCESNNPLPTSWYSPCASAMGEVILSKVKAVPFLGKGDEARRAGGG